MNFMMVIIAIEQLQFWNAILLQKSIVKTKNQITKDFIQNDDAWWWNGDIEHFDDVFADDECAAKGTEGDQQTITALYIQTNQPTKPVTIHIVHNIHSIPTKPVTIYTNVQTLWYTVYTSYIHTNHPSTLCDTCVAPILE